MSTKAKSKSKDKKTYFKQAILVLSVVGLILSAYLTYLHFADGQAAFCSEGSECDEVRQSGFAAMLGVPVAALGILGYAVIIVFTLISISKRQRWLYLYIIALGGFTFSAYLTYIELFVIKAVCKYCIVSALIMTAILFMLLFRKSEFYPKFSSVKTIVLGFFVVLVVLTGAFAFQSSQLTEASLPSYKITPADSYTVSLAKYLGSRGAVMYGSFKCPHCNEQKEMFGSAFKYVKYIECHPKGPEADPSLCYAKGIQNFPTWEINGRYYQGAMSFGRLSDLSGFEKTGQ